MKIGIAQLTASLDLAENRQTISELASATPPDVDLLVYPEASMRFFGPPEESLASVAEPLDGPFVSNLADLARKYSMAIAAGMIERIEGSKTHAYNTIVVVGEDGGIIGAYRKIHLFDSFGVVESDRISPGRETLTFSLGEHKLGVMACYDLRFPELSRALVDKGVDILLVPAAWRHGLLKEYHWKTLVRARAIENTSWVVAAAQVGGVYSGSSMVVDPMGVVVASLGEEAGVGTAEVSPARTAAVRSKLPCLEHRRYKVELIEG